ncbi:synaptic vesicle glycoprotein 2A isoform X2 [Musca domestica]|uniref:Synaptic vesicle glycoprotein 2A isoform X2 n=1 Tax=Musca domestica TaxID=7370 RepID=A0A1I8N038_MUSDO|nr:synaptic vesicle glycoprotein 2A isoform X2 [Musca domestica]
MQFSDGSKQSRPLTSSTSSMASDAADNAMISDNQRQGEGMSAAPASDNNNAPDSFIALEPKGSAAPNAWDYNEILNILGFGKFNWLMLLNSGLLTLTSMAAQLAVGIIGISSQCEFNMTQGEKGVMMAACVTGIVLSTYLCGYVCDILGRRTVLMWAMFITNALQLISMFVSNIWVFNFVNFLMGISLGGVSSGLYPYLGEFTSNKYRAVAINYSTMFVSVTAIYVPAISWWVLSADWSWEISSSLTFRPWRLIILLSMLPGFIAALMLVVFPESPLFLMAQGRHDEAVKALNYVSRLNTGMDLEMVLKTPNVILKPEEISDAALVSGAGGCSFISNIWKATLPLFHKPHGLNVILAVSAMFGMLFSSNGMQIWFPEIVNRSAGDDQNVSSTICEKLEDSYARDRMSALNATSVGETACDDTIATKTYVDNIVVGLAFFVGFSIQGALLNPLGRKNVLLAALAVGAVCGLLLHVVTNTTGLLVLFCLYILLPGLSMSIMCGALVDLVPTHLKGKTASLGLTMGRVGIIVASNLISAMLEPYCNGIFAIITLVIIACGGLVFTLPI